MLLHRCTCGKDTLHHPENAQRLVCIFSRLRNKGLLEACQLLQGRPATYNELQLVHGANYVSSIMETTTLPFVSDAKENDDQTTVDGANISLTSSLSCGGKGTAEDTYFNGEVTAMAARLACGSVIELVTKIVLGSLQNGFAIVRPPGHHAESDEAMGFCFFNNVAVAARYALTRLGVKRILIVDWDIHHGNGIQEAFYAEPRVLYLSLHRYDGGNYYPFTGAATECGRENARGTNVNIPWTGKTPIGNAEYLAAFERVVMPIAHEFEPELVLVSAGFDASIGHPNELGGYKVTPEGFAYMTAMLKTVAHGRLAMALEGGYMLDPVSRCVESCVRALLNEPLPPLPPRIVKETCWLEKDGLVLSLDELRSERKMKQHSSRKKAQRLLLLPFNETETLAPSAEEVLREVVATQKEFYQMKKMSMREILQTQWPANAGLATEMPSVLTAAVTLAKQLHGMHINPSHVSLELDAAKPVTLVYRS